MNRIGFFVIWIGVVLLILVGVHRYFWIRLVRDTALPAPWRGIATAGVILLAVSIPAAFFLSRAVSPARGAWLVWPAFVWMGLMFLLLVTLAASDLLGVVLRWLPGLSASGTTLLDVAERVGQARVLGGGALLLALGLGCHGLIAARHVPEVRRIPITLPKLPLALDKTTIVQITDMHVGETVQRGKWQAVVDRVNGLNADVIVITGDLVDAGVEQLRDQVAPVAQLKARYGVFFVTGNHEYYAGVRPWLAYLRSLGIRVLQNERVLVGDAQASFELAGVSDSGGHAGSDSDDRPDIGKALEGHDPDKAVVLLAHQPKEIASAAKHGVGLQLSGHTHGGQLWPFTLLVGLVQPFVAGLHRVGDTQIYVSRGTGYWGPPMRVFAPAEITLVELRSPMAPSGD